ncbi:MAG: GerMN domain-containing protein [Lachnospiraceae bacterium]|nr:GerMN domain-containing protein [Lachnospiraceae bacterium]
MKLRRIMQPLMCVCICVMAMLGCSNGASDNENNTANSGEKSFDYNIYCISEDGNELTTWGYNVSKSQLSVSDKAVELLEAFCKEPANAKCTSAFAEKLRHIDVSIDRDVAYVNIDKNYNKLGSLERLFLRAGVVLTLTQIDEIEYVYFKVNGQPLADSEGNMLGYLSKNSFVMYDESMLSDNQISLTLYYANDTGDKLVGYRQDYAYDGSMSREAFILECLAKSPSVEGLNRTLPEGLELRNIYTNDGICYVNFGSNINSSTVSFIDDEVILYSIVNSLTELDGVTKVQILIEGSVDTLFRNEFPIDQTYKVNLDIIEKR